jgi:hypothetical protein
MFLNMKNIVFPCGQQLTESGASGCFCELSFLYSLTGINRLDGYWFKCCLDRSALVRLPEFCMAETYYYYLRATERN